jgi:Saxitoxin biosynthesis operon protein SxtJ
MKEVTVSSKELRNFGLVTGAIFTCLFGLTLPYAKHHSFPLWPWPLCAGLWLAALLTPYSLKCPFIVWQRLGLLLGWINSRIVLTAIFFLFVVPTGFLTRLFRNDQMFRAIDPDAPSYRTPSQNLSPEHMEHPF